MKLSDRTLWLGFNRDQLRFMMQERQILTLLTDFGLKDSYVGTMKGVIAQINPSLQVIDLTHEIPPQNLIAARFCLMNAYSYFPMGTVHVAVVDPGVGSSRRAIAVQLAESVLVGPDNGLFSGILAVQRAIAAVELTNREYWRTPNPSSTFHGRDIFAPVGAYLASGVPLEQVGNPLNPAHLVQLPLPESTEAERQITGFIQYIDQFGNLVTTIPEEAVVGRNWVVMVPGQSIPRCESYAGAAVGEAVALIGSHGYVEIAVNCGNAQAALQIDWGQEVIVRFQ